MDMDDETLCYTIMRWVEKNPDKLSYTLQEYIADCTDMVSERGSLKISSRDSLDSIVKRHNIPLELR